MEHFIGHEAKRKYVKRTQPNGTFSLYLDKKKKRGSIECFIDKIGMTTDGPNRMNGKENHYRRLHF